MTRDLALGLGAVKMGHPGKPETTVVRVPVDVHAQLVAIRDQQGLQSLAEAIDYVLAHRDELIPILPKVRMRSKGTRVYRSAVLELRDIGEEIGFGDATPGHVLRAVVVSFLTDKSVDS